MIAFFLKDALSSSVLAKFGALLARPAIDRFRAYFDPRRYNGAMLLGLNGICVKSHGGTDEVGFAHAVEVGVNLVRRNFNELIKEGPNHPRYNSLFSGWRSEAVRRWDGQVGELRYRGSNEARVKFLEIGNEVMVVTLRKEDGNWFFEDIHSPSRRMWEDYEID